MLAFPTSIRRGVPAALLLLPLLSAGARGEQVGLELRRDALVRGRIVLLGDVAVVDGPAALAARLAALPVGTAPLTGYAETLGRAALEAALRAQPRFVDARFAWRGAERVVVRRAGMRVDGAAIADAARDMLQAVHGVRHAQLDVTPLGTVADVQVPEGVAAVRAREVGMALRARTTVWVDILVDGAVVRSAMVPFQVQAWDQVLVARRALPADAALAASDFRVERRDVLALAAAPAQAPASWTGLRLALALAEGDVMPARAMVPAGAVRRGDRVRLVVDDALLRIETAAVAQEDGVAGAQVRVMPANGGEAVAARVVGQGVVAIEGR